MIPTRAVSITLAGLVLGAFLIVVTQVTGRTAPALSRDVLEARFASDIRNLVYRWDPADPRPVAARQRALFEFMYQTYDRSAWIPQSVFDGNVITQIVAGDVRTIVRDRVGLALWSENADVPAYGMAPNPDPHQPLSWTVNCLVCHMAEIDGVVYFGAGTKTFDEVWLGESLKKLMRPEMRGI